MKNTNYKGIDLLLDSDRDIERCLALEANVTILDKDTKTPIYFGFLSGYSDEHFITSSSSNIPRANHCAYANLLCGL